MRALSIAWKDLRRTYGSVAGLALMLAAPLLLAFVLGLAFGSADNFSIAAVKTALVNQDEGAGAGVPAAGATLTGVLTSDAMSDILAVTQVDTPAAARALVDDGDADVAVIIPSGLSAALMGGADSDGGTSPGNAAGPGGEAAPSADAGSNAGGVEIEIYRDPALNVGPAIVTSVVQSVLQSLDAARAAAVASAQLAVSNGVTDPVELREVAMAAAQAFTADAQAEVPIEMEERAPVVPGVETQKRPNVASQVLVGMMLFFMLFGASIPARSILDEHREGTLSRLFTTPTSRSVIMGGKYVAVFSVVLVQALVLVLAGWILLGADWGKPGPLILLILASSLVAASLGLVTVSFAKTPAQAGAVSSAIFVFLGLISGSFTGGVAAEGWYAVARRISPLGWLMDGWKDVLYGGSWGGVVLPVIVALGFALLFFGIATFFFRRRYA